MLHQVVYGTQIVIPVADATFLLQVINIHFILLLIGPGIIHLLRTYANTTVTLRSLMVSSTSTSSLVMKLDKLSGMRFLANGDCP